MNASHPPPLPTWLLSRLVLGANRDSLIGDLIEQYQRGRSTAWYWRQTLGAISASFAAEIWRHKTIALAVLLFSHDLDTLYVRSRVWVLVWKIDRLWYPRMLDSRWSWLGVNPWAYRLQPYSWTASFGWCALLVAVAWLMSRVYTQERGLVIALLLTGQLAARAPFLWTITRDVIREPADPVAFYGWLWFSFYTLVAIPLSVYLGSRPSLSQSST